MTHNTKQFSPKEIALRDNMLRSINRYLSKKNLQPIDYFNAASACLDLAIEHGNNPINEGAELNRQENLIKEKDILNNEIDQHLEQEKMSDNGN